VPDDQHLPEPDPPKPEQRLLDSREVRIAAAILIGMLVLGLAGAGIGYLKFARMVDRRLAAGAFSNTFNIFTMPRTVARGDRLTPEQVAARLRHGGYTTSRSNPVGSYHVTPRTVEIFPGRESFVASEPAVLEFSDGKISRIFSLRDQTERQTFELEPQLITNLSGQRERRRLVRFSSIPLPLVNAVISVEDKHFFQHSGFDLSRILKAAYIDLKDGHKEQGASTLTMQLARGFWLGPQKRWKRKVEEILLTLHLEGKLTKQQIFEDYANEVYLGRRGTFAINGFGQAARSYFGKEVSQLSNAECALLAGLVQRPSYYNPFRYPERARDRRNVVLTMMRHNGYLPEEEYRAAMNAPLTLTPEPSEGVAGQYFIDLMNDELQTKLAANEKDTRYVYTTIDPDLQEAAQEAARLGMQDVDQELRKKRREAIPEGQPQVALIALDPHTGEIKALVGGRDYVGSQLNHVLAMRQPGSVFKPFVYAAGLKTAIEGGPEIFTPASVLNDEPASFFFGNQVYTPGNYHSDFSGEVTLRTALAHSLNIPTVQLAQEVGYRRVVAMARSAGLNDAIQPTPSVALGAYETTPLEIAGAYTVFANRGMHVDPTTIALVRAQDGTVLYQRRSEPRAALDSRVAYLMVNLMQEVLRSGTGAGVRARGFLLPAAGKTGTSRDGWFAGFTSELLCVVWVGFDDNRDLSLEGALSALPIWAEFMKRAAQFRPYRDAKPFAAPPGVVSAEICSDSGQLAGPDCPEPRLEVFISGSQPEVECELHGVRAHRQSADRMAEQLDGRPAAGRK